MSASDEMTAFVRAVEVSGFSAAARELGLTPSALSKLVTRLENRLGVRLLNRTTRRLALTPEGDAFYQRSRRILAEIEEAETEVARFRERPRGRLRLSIGVAFGMHQLVPALPRFLARYPEVEVDLSITDRLADLLEDGIDVAVRTGDVIDESLIARRICELHRVVCAAPAYLERHGTPRTPQDLAGHNCINIGEIPGLSRWPFDGPNGVQPVQVHGNVTANNAQTVLQLAIMGVGIIRLADVIVGHALRQGWLVPVLQGAHHVEPLPLIAVYPPGRHRSPKVAAFVEFLIEEFAHAPWREG